MVKDYGHFMRDDAAYADRAAKIGALARDTVEVVADAWPDIAPKLAANHGAQKVAFHSPCTLQHGMKLKGRVEAILAAMGIELTPVRDAHLCCGSAGTFSMLQPQLAGELKRNKQAALLEGEPDLIATANIGCLMHLGEGCSRPVQHWIELLDARMSDDGSGAA
jgi:glycolate oxidase iron-sulfur subunit